MAEAAPLRAVRIEMYQHSRGKIENTNAAMQVVGGGATITTSAGALNIESPVVSVVEINDAQVVGLLGYIGLLNAGIDTSAIETAIATLVAAS